MGSKKHDIRTLVSAFNKSDIQFDREMTMKEVRGKMSDEAAELEWSV